MDSDKGSVTVELAIIFPIMIYILFLLIYIIILMYQEAYAKNVCDDAINKAGNWWTNTYKDYETGKVSIDNISHENVYANLYDMNENSKIQLVKEYIYNRLNSNTILKPSKFDMGKDINIKVANFIIYKKLYLNTNVTYELPVPKLIKIFNIRSDYTFELESSVLIKDYAGYINDINFMFYAYDEAKDKVDWVRKIHEALDSIKKKVFY
ncbi:MAG TPA: hypothetical protein DCP90_08615 [Clostridiales bacterium]|nr:MAG: hypothetical protein A2Y22_05810 [Clostridiales bacterium GWD2_32_59]HAN10656.1 hypothetical protein [Clostridiales bacterium]